MDRRTALQALVAVITGGIATVVLAGGHTLTGETSELNAPMIYLPDNMLVDFTGMKTIQVQYGETKAIIEICELMNALIGDQSGQLVYTPGKDMCK